MADRSVDGFTPKRNAWSARSAGDSRSGRLLVTLPQYAWLGV